MATVPVRGWRAAFGTNSRHGIGTRHDRTGINHALFVFPAGSVNYVNHTWETVEEEEIDLQTRNKKVNRTVVSLYPTRDRTVYIL